jgi:hypothetical protein
MTDLVDTLSGQFQQFGESIVAQISHEQPFNEIWGLAFPHINKHQFAQLFINLGEDLLNNRNHIDYKVYNKELQDVSNTINYLQNAIILNNNINGDPNSSISALFRSHAYMRGIIQRIIEWKPVASSKMLPPALIRKLQDLQADIDSIAPDKKSLKEQIDLIAVATATAEELPTTLQRLKQNNDLISSLLAQSNENNGRIHDNTTKSKEFLEELEVQAKEAKLLISQCEEAYRITTTRGLAVAFEERAASLKISMRWWVGLLSAALIAGAIIGYLRVEQLTIALNAAAPDWGVILTKAILSAVSIGAPLWLAWLSTKQIGQRFRLAEDYGFKASVAKAYEGYRREAAKIDEAFVSRLFGSVLSRLEEAPLRFVEQEVHSSPWDELRKTSEFNEAVEKVPAFVDRVAAVLKAKAPVNTKIEASTVPKSPESAA